MTICLKQILFHQEQLKSNLKELFSHFGKYVKQYTNIFAEVGELLKINSYFKASARIKPSEIDNVRYNGAYWVDESEDIPSIKNTCLLVFNSSYNNTIQFIASYSGATLKYRIKWVSNDWTPWKELL